jgi:hypothetical protein
MQIKRLEKLLNENIFYENMAIIYGYLNDLFCDKQLSLSNLEYQLYRSLKNNGYKRILFIDSEKSVYAFDTYSLNSCLPNIKAEELVKGPLGDYSFFNRKVEKKFNYYNGFIEVVDTILNDNIQTTIFFKNFDELLLKNDASIEIIKKVLKSFLKNNGNNSNKIILAFDVKKSEEVKNTISIHNLSFLKELLEENINSLIKINLPEKDEIYNLLNYLRIKNNMAFNWEELDEVLLILKNQKLKLKNIYNKLKNTPSNFVLDIEFTKKLSKELDEHLKKEQLIDMLEL